MPVEFYKFHAVGNDFLILDGRGLNGAESLERLAQRLCHRHLGIGADGLIVWGQADSSEADVEMRLFNSDGSEAEISGNGVRCLAAYLYFIGEWAAERLRVATRAGVKTLHLLERDGPRFRFLAEMGRPRLASTEIPMALEPPQSKVVNYPLDVGDGVFLVTACSMGNPHCVVLCDDLEALDIRQLGPVIEHHPLFPARTNVEFVRVLDRRLIALRMWERGAGETLSSGTGASAALVAAVLNDLTDRQVRVRTAVGDLEVTWREDDVITVTGTAEAVCRGVWLGSLADVV
ncbi:MAG TPA: diaminopimelate epimerase [Blastocatellia bacterium]|nr:diaminopimelate epimerase [Blastocatellia bacterium]